MTVREFLRTRASWFNVAPEEIERNGAVFGNEDKGDIRGIPNFVIECKDEQKIDLPQYLREAEVERQHAGSMYAAVIVKARRKPVEDAYVVMDLDTFTRLVAVLSGN